MKVKYDTLYIYRIDFEARDSGDYGWDLFEAHTVDEAIETFRAIYSKDRYCITDVYKKIGKESGAEAWAAR